MVDRLQSLLGRFAVSAEVFHAGPLCGINHLAADGERGQLHLIRDGTVRVEHDDGSVLQIDQPSVLLYPRPLAHRFITDAQRGADFACAHLQFEGAGNNPVAAALPAVICLPLDALYGGHPVLSLLFEEAFAQRCGRQALLDRLFEVVLIQILRALMESGQLRVGLLAGMAHPRLRHALVAMHEAPAEEWTLESLAQRAGMSRSAFADSFRDTIGSTPGQYLQGWRTRLVQQALRRGQPLKRIAIDVGYGSEAALSRAFKAQTGQSPRQWKQVGAAARAP
ncbi:MULTISPECIES: AraC family transcriptional regulator [Stenotrophomonas]|jgi:AraC-like DNA-binding protein|uniref:AraC family transcriptional regulator n=1 Tax=Stenotrophomonas maltophilia TaxID=40324 RepID=A0A4S2CTJ6_STEMA|nr:MULTISPECIES: AraC family transcriptional regulator [Stenotrophomonas]TGY32217.1 AraC family transcriptional regulator [Stenotrophomonas maltophilia]